VKTQTAGVKGCAICSIQIPREDFHPWKKINQLATKAGITALEQTEALKSTSEQNQSVGLTVAHI
ncbi:hypothetical protein, partial [Salmonella enterica]|uniref:hypothetical protein n=1 Tax=Salmonella enterica TaxID=28901 RepID=UPI001C388395